MKICTVVLGAMPKRERSILLDHHRPASGQLLATLVFARMLSRVYQPGPGVWAPFVVTANVEVLAQYCVALTYDGDEPTAQAYADRVLNSLPERWDDKARLELSQFERNTSPARLRAAA